MVQFILFLSVMVKNQNNSLSFLLKLRIIMDNFDHFKGKPNLGIIETVKFPKVFKQKNCFKFPASTI